MLENNKNPLIFLWCVFSIASVINVLILYWIPILLPIGSYSTIYLAAISFIEKRYYLLVVSLLICVVLILTIFSIKRNRFLLPALSLLYILIDLIFVFRNFVLSIIDGMFYLWIVPLVVLFSLVVLLCKYCWRGLDKRRLL